MDEKYFIKDTALQNRDDDYFGHLDYAQNIINILSTQEPPFNIALLGKWGLGKSSLINFVESHFTKDRKFEFITINAWKYEKEAFRKVFLKKTWERLGGNEKSWFSTLRDALNNTIVKETETAQKPSFGDRAKSLLGFLAKAGIFFVTIMILSLAWRFIGHILVAGFSVPVFSSADGNPYIFSIYDATVATFYSNALIAATLPVLFALIREFLSSYDKKAIKNFNLVSPAKTTDDYESLLLEQLNKPENKDKIVITIIDDLDRLEVEKIVDALDAIKSFTDVHRCVFVVPFDESKIKEAIESERENHQQANCYAISELLLDKLFQFRVYLPGIIKRDFIPYAKVLCKAECPSLVSLCDSLKMNCFDEELLPIMIHYNVDTPRQIKKIINVFANNVLILSKRKKNNKINIDLDSNVLRQVAKLSVLQADFSGFYNKLYEHPTLLEDFPVLAEQGEKDEPDADKTSKEIYNILMQEKTLNCEYLIDFLNNNRHIQLSADQVRTLIYISDSKAAMRAGGKEQELANALSVGNGKRAKSILDTFDDPCAYLVNELLEGQLSKSTEKQYLVSIYQIFKELDANKRKKLSDELSKRTKIAMSYSFTESSSIKISDVISVYAEADDKLGAEDLIVSKTGDFLADTSKTALDNLFDGTKTIFENRDKLSERIITSFKEKVIKAASIPTASPNYDAIFTIANSQQPLEQDSFEAFIDESFVMAYAKGILNEEIISGSEWDVFLNIWDLYITNFGADKMPNMAYSMLCKFIYFDLLYDKIIVVKDEIGEGMSLLIEAITQIEATDENSDRLISMLEALDWHIYDDIYGDIDALLNRLSEFRHIDNLLKTLAEKGNFSMLTDTIKGINSEVFNKDNPYIKIINALAAQYNQEQSDELTNKLNTNLQPSTAIDIVKMSVGIFKKLKTIGEYSDALFAIKSNVISLFNNNFTRQPQWASEIVEVAGYKHNADEVAFTNYLNNLNHLFATNRDLSIKGWKSITGKVNTDSLTTMLSNVFSVDWASDVEKMPDVYRLLQTWEHSIHKRPECIQNYESFLIGCLRADVLVEDAIVSLGKINDLENLLTLFECSLVLDNGNKQNALKIVANRLKNSDFKHELLTEILSCDNFDNSSYLFVIREIYDSPETEYFVTLLENINDQSPYAFMVNLLSMLSLSLSSYKKSNVLSLIKNIVRNGKEKCADDIIPILNNMGGYFISNQHKYELKGCIESVKPTQNTNKDAINQTITVLGLLDKQTRKKKKWYDLS